MAGVIPKEVKEFKDLAKRAERISNATELAHTEAYLHGARQAGLFTADGEELDLDKLEDSKIQQKMADSMSEFYITKAKEYFKSGIDTSDPLKADSLMTEYAGVTKREINRYIMDLGKEYTPQVHDQKKGEFMDKVRRKLSSATSGNLRDEHISPLLKHMGIEDIVDSSKIRLDEAVQLHGMYIRNKGSLTKQDIERAYRGQQEGTAPIYLKK